MSLSLEVRLVCNWIRLVDVAQSDIVALHGQRVLWREMVGMLDAKESIPGRYLIRNILTQSYLAHQLLGIRRHQDLSGSSASLARIWDSMKRHTQLVRRDRYVEWTSIDDFTKRASEHYFDQQFGRGKDHLDAGIAESHIERITVGLADIRKYVNRNLAHLRADPASGGKLTFGRVDEALAVLAAELDTLSLLVRGISIPNAEPVIQGPWRGAFFMPWASDNEVRMWQEAKDFLESRDS